MADDFLQPQPQQGEIVQQQALLHEAPISGAPMPSAAPAAQQFLAPHSQLPTAGYMPVASPPAGPDPAREAYYLGVAKTWAKLAKAPHATPLVKEMATRSRQYLQAVRKGEV